jgi:hypothetical protein
VKAMLAIGWYELTMGDPDEPQPIPILFTI